LVDLPGRDLLVVLCVVLVEVPSLANQE